MSTLPKRNLAEGQSKKRLINTFKKTDETEIPKFKMPQNCN